MIKLWARFFEPHILSDLLTFIGDNSFEMANSVAVDILPCLLQSLKHNATPWESPSQLHERCRLPQLVSLLPILGNNIILEEMIAAVVMANLPLDLGATPVTRPRACQLASRIATAEVQWSHRLEAELDGLIIETFLERKSWTLSTVRIISGLLYRQPAAQGVFLRWLLTDDAADTDVEYVTLVIHAFLDAASSSRLNIGEDEMQALEPHLRRLITAALDERNNHDLQRVSMNCISIMCRLFPSKRPLLFSSIEEHLRSLPDNCVPSCLVAFGNAHQVPSYLEAVGVVDLLIDFGLRWFIGCCTGNNEFTEDEQGCVTELSKSIQCIGRMTWIDLDDTLLARLIKASGAIKSHSTETALIVTVRHRLHESCCVNLLSDLLQATQLKVSVAWYFLSFLLTEFPR